jgi:hypothetical protein
MAQAPPPLRITTLLTAASLKQVSKAAHLGEVLFWLFFLGFSMLFIYLGGLALRLSAWGQSFQLWSANQCDITGPIRHLVHPPTAHRLM